MTEADWLASDDPAAMLAWITGTSWADTSHEWDGRLSPRKLRLFACACRRQKHHDWERGTPNQPSWRDIEDRPGLQVGNVPAMEHALLFVGGRVPPEFCPTPAVAAALLRDIAGNPFRPATLTPVCDRCDGGKFAVGSDRPFEWTGPGTYPGPCPKCRGVGHLCPWLTPTALALAHAAYDERLPDGRLDPELLAVLSDALEAAGAPTDERCPACGGMGRLVGGVFDPAACSACGRTGRVPHPLLAHLRSPGPHYRGMWSLDVILGKE